MDFTGFNKAYPAKRPLTDQERERRLLQKMRLDVKEGDDLSVTCAAKRAPYSPSCARRS